MRLALSQRKKHVLFSVSLVLLLVPFLLVGYMFLPMSTAKITIMPRKQYLKGTYSVSLVEGKPSTGEVAMRLLTVPEQAQSRTGSAAGKGQQPGTKAQGQVQISQIQLITGANSEEVGKSKVKTNSGVSITIGDFTAQQNGSAVVSTEADESGTNGNIPAHDVDGLYDICSAFVFPTCDKVGTAYVQNLEPFSGGTDPRDYTFVQSTDISNLTEALKQQLSSEIDTKLKQQMHQQEKPLHEKDCEYSIQSNHNSGDEATEVRVDVSVHCSLKVYEEQEVQKAVQQLQEQEAMKRYGSDYKPMNALKFGELNDLEGKDGFQVPVEGWWIYHFDAQQMARSFAGKPQWWVTNDLHNRSGIKQFTLSAVGFGGALPSAPERIEVTSNQ
jgi:hypothetical protein